MFFRLENTLDHNAKLKLKKSLPPEEFRALISLTLEDVGERKAFVEKQLGRLAAALDSGDKDGIAQALEILGAGVHSLTPVQEKMEMGSVPGVEDDSFSPGRYQLNVGSGTRGNRIFLYAAESDRRDFLVFPPGAPGSTPDLQQGFMTLFGDRARSIPSQFEPAEQTVVALIRETTGAPCPCGSGKKFKECHGA